MKKVSVIVPVYNASAHLEQCLDSLVNQTLKDFEVIAINDASTDNSLEILKRYEKKYPRKIKLINNKKNLGIGKTRNKGLKAADAEYIGFVDSDDYVELNMYEEYYDYAKRNNLDIATGYYYKIETKEKQLFQNDYFEITNVHLNKNLINMIDYGPANKVFKHELIKEHNIQFEEQLKYEDMPFVLKGLYYSEKVGHINKAYYNYRIHYNSETTTMNEKVFDMFEILNICNKIYQDDKFYQEKEYLNIKQITRYMLQQKKQKSLKIKNEFINQGYENLNNNFPKWKLNTYYKEEPISKRFIKNNKILMKIYCLIGR